MKTAAALPLRRLFRQWEAEEGREIVRQIRRIEIVDDEGALGVVYFPMPSWVMAVWTTAHVEVTRTLTLTLALALTLTLALALTLTLALTLALALALALALTLALALALALTRGGGQEGDRHDGQARQPGGEAQGLLEPGDEHPNPNPNPDPNPDPNPIPNPHPKP